MGEDEVLLTPRAGVSKNTLVERGGYADLSVGPSYLLENNTPYFVKKTTIIRPSPRILALASLQPPNGTDILPLGAGEMKIETEITHQAKAMGAALIGFADLTVLPAQVRRNLPRAVAFAVALAPDIIAAIQDGPTKEYYAEYARVNAILGEMSISLAHLLRGRGFSAVSSALLPHKTVATLAGLGWRGTPNKRLHRTRRSAPVMLDVGRA